MSYTTVAVASAYVRRDGLLLPGFIYISSNEAADRAGDLGLYDVWLQSAVNPFPVYEAQWMGSLSDSDLVTVRDPAELEGTLRELCAEQERIYILYHFFHDSITGSGVDVFVEDHYSVPTCILYEADLWCGRQWYRATRFTYRRPSRPSDPIRGIALGQWP